MNKKSDVKFPATAINTSNEYQISFRIPINCRVGGTLHTIIQWKAINKTKKFQQFSNLE